MRANLLDEVISKLLNMFSKKEFIPQIIQFFKNLTLIYNFELRYSVLKNIKEVMSYIYANKAGIKINEEDGNDINTIVCFINNKFEINKLAGHSELISNFDQENNINSNNNYVYVKSNVNPNRLTKK